MDWRTILITFVVPFAVNIATECLRDGLINTIGSDFANNNKIKKW